MKNILYIANWDQNEETGVFKKIKGQIKAMKNLGNNVSYIATKDKEIYLNENNTSKFIKKCSSNKIVKQIQIINENIKFIRKNNNIEFIYMRYMFSTPQVIRLFKIAKKKNIRIVEEIPTYPYDSEMKNGNRLDLKLALKVDKHYRKKLKKYVDNIATFSDDDEIFGIRTIKIENGIDVDNVEILDVNLKTNEINMIAVSVLEYWQGYDRIIKSLKDYYDSKKNDEIVINLHIIGDGTEREKLEKMTKEYKLENNITFYGFLSGKELDDVYKKCQCGIAGLGIFRKGISNARTLKIREYTARAIPFVYSTNDDSIKNFKYAYKVSDDEQAIDLRKIIEFLNGLENTQIKNDMREFASKNYKWEPQMEKVLNTKETKSK